MNLRPVLLAAAVVAGAFVLVAVGRQIGPVHTAETAGLYADDAVAVPTASPGSIAEASATSVHADAVARGEYLVTIGGCNDCHTPWVLGPDGPEPDMTRMLSGHPAGLTMPPAPAALGPWVWNGAGTNTAFAGPWGVSFAANLTPEENTGTGVWTEEIFIKTIRTGRHWGQSRPILPPMPWSNYARMTDEDLRAVYSYLRTVPPIHNPVPQPLPPAGVPAVAIGG